MGVSLASSLVDSLEPFEKTKSETTVSKQLKWQTTKEVFAMRFVETYSIKILTIGGITVGDVVDFHS